jgi:hypothetical protein
MHDILYVPDFLARSTRSGLTRDGRVREGGMLVLDDGGHSSTAFYAGLLGGMQLSPLPDPCSVREAIAASDAEGWRDTMDQEMDNLRCHDVYELVPRTSGMRTLGLGWVLHRGFKISVFEKNKGRLVALDSHQRPGADYGKSFSPVMRSLPTLLALAAIRDLDAIQFDITSVYLHRTLKVKVYTEPPWCYIAPDERIGYGASRKVSTAWCRQAGHRMRSSTVTWRVRDSRRQRRIWQFMSRIPGQTAISPLQVSGWTTASR